MTQQQTQPAKLYRMVMPGHTCPYGLKSKDLLERQGFEVEDHHLTTREETDAFKAKHDVETTPQYKPCVVQYRPSRTRLVSMSNRMTPRIIS